MIPGLTVLKRGMSEAARRRLLQLARTRINYNGHTWNDDKNRWLAHIEGRSVANIDQPDLLHLTKKFLNPSQELIHVMFQSYNVGHSMMMHRDGANYTKVVIVFLAGAADLVFKSNADPLDSLYDPYSFVDTINPGTIGGDILIMEGPALNNFTHGIEKVTQPRTNIVIRYQSQMAALKPLVRTGRLNEIVVLDEPYTMLKIGV